MNKSSRKNLLPFMATVIVGLVVFFRTTDAHAGFITDVRYLNAVIADKEGRYADAAAAFEKLTSSKDPGVSGHAAYQLSEYYRKGSGVPQSFEKSFSYLDKAISSKDSTWAGLAAHKKGMYYEFGVENFLAIDRIKAYECYSIAKEKGYEGADKDVSRMISFPDVYVSLNREYFGPMADQEKVAAVAVAGEDAGFAALQRGDLQEAKRILHWHARRGSEMSQYAMAIALLKETSTDAGIKRMGWVYLSAKNGRPESQSFYGQFLVEETKAPVEDGMRWIVRAGEQGYGFAENLLGIYILNGVRNIPPLGVEPALTKFRRAVELGNPQAMINLGDIYFDGSITTKDEKLARSYYRQAAAVGDQAAIERLSMRFNEKYADSTAGVGIANQVAGNTNNANQASLANVLGVPDVPEASLLLDRRVALVIGNSTYIKGALKNPANDARRMKTELESANFKVFYIENGSLQAMYERIDAFAAAIPRDGVAVVYYAGHGLQVSGENYLIPIDANFGGESEVKYKSINLGYVLAKLEQASSRINMVILDACRDNPFARSWRSQKGGLAAIDAPSGTLIAFATAPGQVAADGDGSNGLFTGELLKEIKKPNQKIEDILKNTRRAVMTKSENKQIPWESSSLTGDFFFRIQR